MDYKKKRHPISNDNDNDIDIFIGVLIIIMLILFTVGVTILSWYFLKGIIAIYEMVRITFSIL